MDSSRNIVLVHGKISRALFSLYKYAKMPYNGTLIMRSKTGMITISSFFHYSMALDIIWMWNRYMVVKMKK